MGIFCGRFGRDASDKFAILAGVVRGNHRFSAIEITREEWINKFGCVLLPVKDRKKSHDTYNLL